MSDQSNYLFVYGTLRPSFDNSFAHYLRQYSRYTGEGTITGQLVDIGRYPGAIYEKDSPMRVHGTVVELISHPLTILAYLDEYEGVGELFTQPNEYARVIVPVTSNNQMLYCWTYVYNWSIEGCSMITSGDYSLYLSQLERPTL